MEVLSEINLSVADLTDTGRDGMLHGLLGNDTGSFTGPLFGGFAIPLQEPVSSVRDKVLTDLVPCTYDGMVPVALTFTGPFKDENGEPYHKAAALTFIPSGDATIGTQSIAAVAFVGSDSITLHGARNLPAPVTTSYPATPVGVTATFSAGKPANQE